jgi:hypothetical protein
LRYPQRRGGQIIAPKTCLAVCEVFIEDVVAQPNFVEAFQAPQESVVRKLVGEGERTLVDVTFDHFEALASATQVGFRRWALDRGSIADAIQPEVELDPAARRGDHAAREPLAAHTGNLLLGEGASESLVRAIVHSKERAIPELRTANQRRDGVNLLVDTPVEYRAAISDLALCRS